MKNKIKSNIKNRKIVIILALKHEVNFVFLSRKTRLHELYRNFKSKMCLLGALFQKL